MLEYEVCFFIGFMSNQDQSLKEIKCNTIGRSQALGRALSLTFLTSFSLIHQAFVQR